MDTNNTLNRKWGLKGMAQRRWNELLNKKQNITQSDDTSNTQTKEKKESLWNRVSRWFRGTQDKDKIREETESERIMREENEGVQKFLDEFKSQTNLDVAPNRLTYSVNNFLFYEAKLFEQQGLHDGNRGVKDIGIEVSAEARADFIFEHAISIITGKYGGVDAEIKFKEQRIHNTSTDLGSEKEFNNEINTIFRTEHRHFSKIMGTVYVLVGFLMMVTDFPISLSVAKNFVDWPYGVTETFRNKITDPNTVLFSLGITLLSIYYKIIYDEYINISIIPHKNKINDTVSKKMIEKVLSGILSSLPAIIRLFVKLLILFGLLYLLYNIGYLRTAVSDIEIASLYPKIISDEKVFNYKIFSFIGVTIFIPLISGICLSVGFSIFADTNNLKQSNMKIKKLKHDIKTIEDEKIVKEVDKRMLESLQTDWIKDRINKKNKITKLFSNSYNQGYRRGHRAKYGDDIYETALSLYIDHLN